MSVYARRIAKLWERPNALVDAYLIVSPENRFYLSGFTGSAGWLLIGKHSRVLLTDFRYAEQAAAQAPDYEVVVVPRLTQGLAGRVGDSGWKTIGIETHRVTVQMLDQWRNALPGIEWVAAAGHVESLRLVKDANEVARIHKASDIADQALKSITPLIRPGISERAIAVALEHAMRELGADALSFPTIVASGPRGSLPHAEPSTRLLEAQDLVTIDFGAVFDHYHSDETVTWPVSDSQANGRQREIYDIVKQAQTAGLQVLKPGIRVSAVDQATRNVIAQAGLGDYFGHGTGHGVGLEVHEDPFIGPHPLVDFELTVGMVITVEPGVYIPDVLGVRLEDTVVITATGYERLTHWDKQWGAL
ncbi:Xaa-Pro peptidase family protein [Sulfobacillus sp. hq2]|uniref:Peptidase M24 n=1 Tax=Sulfobacillus thermotolerans TaxID=338644 RepID=A0ABM6RVD2_9FIRM|nr:Xaa-Pro peptidase family protein [Sulfobacillus sp. hq2]AUW95426.1 hypothetical protein BXT84_05770 [Sulfobacillus thermotolerans]MCY0908857.1 Xaa-Pro peptidase family protein [Sulfobacillus thermotolerans]POB10998.1 hypothetical protein CO251_08020 [Sulfobacillus sp. hq2]